MFFEGRVLLQIIPFRFIYQMKLCLWNHVSWIVLQFEDRRGGIKWSESKHYKWYVHEIALLSFLSPQKKCLFHSKVVRTTYGCFACPSFLLVLHRIYFDISNGVSKQKFRSVFSSYTSSCSMLLFRCKWVARAFECITGTLSTLWIIETRGSNPFRLKSIVHSFEQYKLPIQSLN